MKENVKKANYPVWECLGELSAGVVCWEMSGERPGMSQTSGRIICFYVQRS